MGYIAIWRKKQHPETTSIALSRNKQHPQTTSIAL